jgi:putative sporulation protein YyaC
MTTFYYNSETENIHMMLGEQIGRLLLEDRAFERDIVIMCIGSDRSTGDSLGPIVGYHLMSPKIENVYIYGDIYNPINAMNLGCSLHFINEIHRKPYIIAIDACLGQAEHIGYVTLSASPLQPGTGIENELPEVGDLHITGIVNTIHHGRHLLHSTRLCTVVTLAKVIEDGIRWVFSK